MSFETFQRQWSRQRRGGPGVGSAKAKLIEAMWKDGLSVREIADLLHSTPGAIGVAMVRLRKAGHDLTYRHNGYPRVPAGVLDKERER